MVNISSGESPLCNGYSAYLWNCDEFEFQYCYFIHFQTNTLGKVKNPLILPAVGWIVPLLVFYKDYFGIK